MLFAPLLLLAATPEQTTIVPIPGSTERPSEATTSYRLAVDKRGGVTECEIVKTSGHPKLDETTCKLLMQRARFNPAKNSRGRPIESFFEGSVNWKIPAETATAK